MIWKNAVRIGLFTLCTALFTGCAKAPTQATTQGYPAQAAVQHSTFSWYRTAWNTIADDFRLAHQNKRQETVQQEINWFQQHQKVVTKITRNANPYIYYVYQETQKRSMPAELALLPMIESAYDPFVFSKTGATGLWQMMPGTASGFGLTINWWYDGRRDIIASTKAALDYLAYLHNTFGDWLLALAAYDSGEGTVAIAIRHNQIEHRPTDFWSLDLPLETKLYVPKLLALAQIIENPRHFNLSIEPISDTPYFTTIKMKGQVEFNRLAKVTRTDLDTIRKLNPGFRRWATQPNGSYHLLIPTAKLALLQTHIEDIKRVATPTWHHKVVKGDTLSKVAAHYHTTASLLRQANGLQKNHLVPGQHLVIPTNRQLLAKSSPANIAEDRLPGPQRVVHVVSRHDSIESVSRRFRVSPMQIRYWNNMDRHAALMPGQQVVIWEKPSYFTATASSYTRYKVHPGDNLYRIAKHFHVASARIRDVNHLHYRQIHVGQVLKIPTRTSA